MTVTPPKFVVKVPEEYVKKKIERSAEQCADMEFREILCPYCGTPLVSHRPHYQCRLRKRRCYG